MTPTERRLLSAIALLLALFAARIVSAQETSDADDGFLHASSAAIDRVPPSGGDSGGLRADDETTLILAQAMVAEAGWDATEDHAAIAHVLQRRATKAGITLREMAVRYVATLRADGDGEYIVNSPRTVWLRNLNLDARKPDGWPSNLSWAAHVPKWVAVLDFARAFQRGEVADPCGSRPAHWGMRTGVDMVRARRAGWVLARCSQRTRNRFWRTR